MQLLAATRSVSVAASRMFVTQSAVSHQLRDIEERAGAPLFVRGRALRLTRAGRGLLERAGPLLRELERFHDARATVRQRLRVTTGCYTSYHWLPRSLRRLEQAHPGLEVHIVLETTRAAVAALEAGKVDVAITTDAPRQKRFAVQALFDDELVAIVAADHPLAGRKRLDAPELRNERVLVYDAPLAELDAWTRFLKPARVSAAVLHRVPLTEAIVQLARDGFGVGILSSWMAEPYVGQGGLRQFQLGAGLKRTWHAVSMAPMPAAARWLADSFTA